MIASQRAAAALTDPLWVADASILPSVTHGNTNLTCVMIGERLADFISGEE